MDVERLWDAVSLLLHTQRRTGEFVELDECVVQARECKPKSSFTK